MSKNNLWGPPTEEEKKLVGKIDLWGPPTQEETKQIPPEKKWYDVTAKGLAQGAVDVLPYAGGTAGFAMGGPVGAVAGAGLGKSLENLIEGLSGQEKTRTQLYAEPIQEMGYAALGESLLPGLGAAFKGTKEAVKSISSELSGVPKKAIETFSKRPEQVSKILPVAEETALQDAADFLRKEAQASITEFKIDANKSIKEFFQEHGDKLIDVRPVEKKLKIALMDLNPKISDHAQQIADITEKLQELNQLKINEKLPFVNASDLQSMKTVLQDAANYDKLGNALERKTLANAAFGSASSEARKLLQEAVPELEKINKQLSQLHNINKNINKNLITPEKSAASVMGVGSGENQQAIKQMQKMEEITGFPYIQEAENIVAAKYFNKPSLFPVQATGRSSIASGLASTGLLGSAVSGNIGPALFGVTTGMMGSPAMIKKTIQAGNIAENVAGKINPMAKQAFEEFIKRSIQLGAPPFLLDKEVQKSLLSPTEKAKLRKQITEQGTD